MDRRTRRTQLHDAAAVGDVVAVRALLRGFRQPSTELEAQTQGYDETALHLSSAKGHVAVVSELILARADVNARRSGGFTPLHLATSVDVARLLLQHGADMDLKSNEGHTASERSLGGAVVQDFLTGLPPGSIPLVPRPDVAGASISVAWGATPLGTAAAAATPTSPSPQPPPSPLQQGALKTPTTVCPIRAKTPSSVASSGSAR